MAVNEAPPPVARVWQMQGGHLDDPAFAETFRSELVPRLETIPGFRGLFVLLDRERQVLRGLSFWEDDAAREESMGVVGAVVQEILRLTSAELTGPWSFDVVVSSFRGVLGRETEPSEFQGLLVRTVRLHGGDVADPEVVRVISRYLGTFLARAPGCLGTLLLLDRDAPSVLGASFWTDAVAAQRTQNLSEEVIEALTSTTHARSESEGTYEVLVSRPMPQHGV